MKNKIIFWTLFIALLAIVVITVLLNTNLSLALRYPASVSNLIQRFLGLTVYALMFWQLMLGAYMQKWTEKLGGWVFTFHVWEGITIYSLAVLHPVFFTLFRYFVGTGFDPIFVFLGFCIYCPTIQDFYYTLGRIAFWLLTIGVFAGLYRHLNIFMQINWRKFHVVNYVTFLLVGIHGLSIGTDFMAMPFFAFAILAYLLVLYTIIRKLPGLVFFLRRWITS